MVEVKTDNFETCFKCGAKIKEESGCFNNWAIEYDCGLKLYGIVSESKVYMSQEKNCKNGMVADFNGFIATIAGMIKKEEEHLVWLRNQPSHSVIDAAIVDSECMLEHYKVRHTEYIEFIKRYSDVTE